MDAAELPLVLVPDVRMCSEASAITEILAADLVPGRRSPRPRPVNRRPEVVIRTHPRAGSLVRRGTRVDYELAPGEPMGPSVHEPGDRALEADADTTLNAAASPVRRPRQDTDTQSGADGFVDYDTVQAVPLRTDGDVEEQYR